jgi:predicted lipoprotein with Yx(FWY)xxD motif
MSHGRSINFQAGARVVLATALLVTSFLAVAGCGGSSSASDEAPPKAANGQPATVGVSKGALGNILVDARGRTLYLFQRDSGMMSACTGACARDWPPLRANGNPTAGGSANAALVATTARSDGKPQVTYNGHPLYLFTGDQKPGDTNGEGLKSFDGNWYAVSPTGDQVSGQESSSGGYGY